MTLLLWLISCGGETCVVAVADCVPQYPPDFDGVWTNTLSPSCALSGCHGAGSSAGGVALGSNPDDAHTALVDGGLVLPGDAACSPVFVAIQEGRMPPGDPLLPEEQCAVRQWIDGGAER